MNVLLLVAIASAITLLVSGILLGRTWRKNTDYPGVKEVGFAIYVSPIIFIPSMYKEELRSHVVKYDTAIAISLVLFLVSTNQI